MRTQQRPFVVEVKSRKRTLAQPKSIWSNTDLKALALKVEEEAPHLFKTVDSEYAVAVERPAEDKPLADIDSAAVKQSNVRLASGDHSVRLEIDGEIASATTSDHVELPLAPSTKKPPRAPTAREHHARKQLVDVADELTALIAENERLKGLLRARLHQENVLLRAMLAKFELNTMDLKPPR